MPAPSPVPPGTQIPVTELALGDVIWQAAGPGWVTRKVTPLRKSDFIKLEWRDLGTGSTGHGSYHPGEVVLLVRRAPVRSAA